MTTLGLTKTFTPPSNCLSDVYRYGDNQLLGPMTASCFPPGAWSNTSTPFWSPGICPSGYATACISARTANTVTETVATCCPLSFNCAAQGNTLGCNSIIFGQKTQRITVMDNAFKSVRTVETEYIGGYMNAYGVQIRFQVSDLLPTTTTGSGIAIAGATPGSSSSGPSQTASSSSSSEGLSTGVQAGIGVGVAVFALIAIVLFWFGFRRARKHRTTVAPAEEDVDQPVHHELKTTPTNPTFGLHEAHVEGAARELPSYPNRPTYELEGSRR